MSTSISIIIPCYNSINTLAKVIDCLNQITLKVFEVIFVDDGSLDGSADFFENNYTGARIIKQPNRGLANARNTGAKEASGKYLQFLDADDTIHPNKLIQQFNFAEAKQCDVVYSDWRMVIVEDGIEKPEPWVIEEPKEHYSIELMQSWWVPFHSYLFRKDAYFQVGGSDDNLINAQDFDLVIRMAMQNLKFSYCPGATSEYYRYINSKSLARTNKKQYWNDYLKSIDKALLNINLIEDNLSKAFRQATSNRLFYIARNVYKYDKKQNLEIIKKIYDINPNFKPDGNFIFRLVFDLFGYRTAEYLASMKEKSFKKKK